MILPKKSRVPGGVPWAKLNIDKHLHADCQLNTDIWCRFTSCLLFWIMTGIFYSWDRSICHYLMMCKSSVKLGLVSKTFINKHTCKLRCCPGKTKCIHCLRSLSLRRHVTPIELCLKVWCIWHTKVETLQWFRSRCWIGWLIQDFRETCVAFFNVPPGNKNAVTQLPHERKVLHTGLLLSVMMTIFLQSHRCIICSNCC